MEIPHTPDDLTPAWLTEALRTAGTISTEKVVSYALGPPTDREGLTGCTVRLTLAYDLPEAAGPSSLIAKFSSATRQLRERPNTRASYAREVCFYRQIRDQVTIPTPHCYYGDFDEHTGYHILLLEDLAPAQSGNRVAGCTVEQAAMAVRQIAAFHADWWEKDALDALSWLSKSSLPDHDALKRLHQTWWPEFIRQAEHILTEQTHRLGARLGEYRYRILEHLNQRPQALVHADYHLDNMIFGEAGSRTPFAVIDWQFVSKGRGIWDVGLFLCQNMKSEDRRAHEQELLYLYAATLAEHGIDYAFTTLQMDYRYCMLQRYCALISSIAAMPFTPGQIQMHIDVLLPRCIAAIEDNDAGAVLH